MIVGSLLCFKNPITQVAYAPPSAFTLIIDKNGYIGSKQPAAGNTYYAYLDKQADFSESGLGQVTIIVPEIGSVEIGGRTYKTTKIGNQTWLAENLDLKFEGGQFNLTSLVNSPAYYYYNRTNSDNTYGLLYNWYSLKYLNDNKDILIPGWRAPTYNDVTTLYNFISTLVPTMLKSKSTWRTGYNGIDVYEFGLLAAGARNDNGFIDRGDYGGFFTLNESSSEQAYNTYCYYSDKSMSTGAWYKATARSLRLIKDT